jgi:hypothetical protein
MNICEKCNKETINPRFCSLRCANSRPRAEKYLVCRSRACYECDIAFNYRQPGQRFCSKSCSARNSNRVSPKRIKTGERANDMCCVYCAIELNDHQFKFCSIDHQQSFYRAKRLAEWLETGKGCIGNDKSHYIRQYIYEQQNNCCAICQMSNEWQGKEIVFVLDHIDGNSGDNSRDNLRLVCPNCDSQLPTYKAKNKGNGRHSRRQRYQDGKSF